MSAALVDVISTGVQDIHLTSRPEISYWRQVYRKYTNFAVNTQRVDYIGSFSATGDVTCEIPVKGDLLTHIHIEAPRIGTAGQNSTGLFSSNAGQRPTTFELWVGGQMVCSLDSLYINGVHNLLYNATEAKASGAQLTGDTLENAYGAESGYADCYTIPFWFSDDWTKSLPLVCMQYSSVTLKIKCRDGFTPRATPKIYCSYATLDTDERKWFVDNVHELLIRQVQYQLSSQSETEIDLSTFNHPVMALHVASGAGTGGHWSSQYSFDKATLYINGTPLFEETSNVFHHTTVPLTHCTVLPNQALDNSPTFTWPFALYLNKSSPSGSLNYSRLDNSKLQIYSPTGNANTQHRVYAVNWNILKVKDGLAGVLYGS